MSRFALDDAGTGSLVGGVLIGGLCLDSASPLIVLEVPVDLFQGQAYQDGEYRRAVAEAAVHVLDRLGAQAGDDVLVCQGWVLQPAVELLEAQGYRVSVGKVGEPLQTLIEQALLEYLRGITGLGEKDLWLNMPPGLHFWKLWAWLRGNKSVGPVLPERAAQAKTGWPSWEAWGSNKSWKEAKLLAKRIKAQRHPPPWGRGEQ
jgi:hypothetical protein